MAEYKMHRITTLKLPQQEEAQKLMEKVAWQVEPIMRKHQWSVPVFAEFLPRGAGLLGLNHNRGQKIQVRLRQNKESGLMDNHGQSDPDAVYASALGTTLHELVHCKIGGASHPSPRAAARTPHPRSVRQRTARSSTSCWTSCGRSATSSRTRTSAARARGSTPSATRPRPPRTTPPACATGGWPARRRTRSGC